MKKGLSKLLITIHPGPCFAQDKIGPQGQMGFKLGLDLYLSMLQGW